MQERAFPHPYEGCEAHSPPPRARDSRDVDGGPAALRAMLAAELLKLRDRRPYPGMPEIVLRFDDAPPSDDGLPTLRQRIETLYWVPDILERGAAWFASQAQCRRWAGA